MSFRAPDASIVNDGYADVIVENEGTLFLFRLRTDLAREWVENNVADDAQFFGEHTLVVEHRFALPLAEGMLEAGLDVQ